MRCGAVYTRAEHIPHIGDTRKILLWISRAQHPVPGRPGTESAQERAPGSVSGKSMHVGWRDASTPTIPLQGFPRTKVTCLYKHVSSETWNPGETCSIPEQRSCSEGGSRDSGGVGEGRTQQPMAHPVARHEDMPRLLYLAKMRRAALSSASLAGWRPWVMFSSAEAMADQKRPISGKLGMSTPWRMFFMVAWIRGSEARLR